MSIKQKLYIQCQELLNVRLENIKTTILDLQNALQSETKSSAGDKHETGRAMIQLEREKAGQQLVEVQKLNRVLSKIDTETQHQTIALGSVVYTTNGNYFIAVSLGKLEVNGIAFYAISPQTPIGKLVLSKIVDNTFQFRNRTFTITKVE